MRTALVIIPGNVNYFYNLNGRRVAESLQELGFCVVTSTLDACEVSPYDLGIVVHPAETLVGSASRKTGLAKIRALKAQCRLLAATSLEAVRTPWFAEIMRIMKSAGIDVVLDFGFHSQVGLLPRRMRGRYRFLTNGLTRSERRCLDRSEQQLDGSRQIPWAFVGHQTPHRAALIDYLVNVVDPRGLVYMPNLSPCREMGSPHLNQEQYEAVLRHAKYQLWCSHHDTQTYLESERFRMSVLSGSVPVKVSMGRADLDESIPFHYLVIDVRHLASTLRCWNFADIRQRFRADFKKLEPLDHGLERFLHEATLADSISPDWSGVDCRATDLPCTDSDDPNGTSLPAGAGLCGKDTSS
ncbi:hypothetical protein AYO40_02040 [Planctomycetaceae bacterium SCGC AG-212-D15]|nr:hypothetical protein AYO40_02040 [Planctomycetaceae bacterium SCGC AG-212-D15]